MVVVVKEVGERPKRGMWSWEVNIIGAWRLTHVINLRRPPSRLVYMWRWTVSKGERRVANMHAQGFDDASCKAQVSRAGTAVNL